MRGGRGQSSTFRGSHSQSDNSQLVNDNPFLKGLSSENQQKSSAQTLDNPFLKGLSRPQQPHPPPPSYDSFITNESDGQSSTHPLAPSLPPYIAHGPDSASSGGRQPNPFLASSRPSDTNSRGIPVLTTEREEKEPSSQQPRVSFDPSLTRPESTRSTQPRMLSYSEVAALHTRSVMGPRGRGGRVTHPPQQANYKTLHVKGIPDELNTNAVLRTHFAQFGEVKLLKCFPSKKYATVEFVTNVSLCICILLVA